MSDFDGFDVQGAAAAALTKKPIEPRGMCTGEDGASGGVLGAAMFTRPTPDKYVEIMNAMELPLSNDSN